jgi:ParB/RepB/Spo0J family partition protein
MPSGPKLGKVLAKTIGLQEIPVKDLVTDAANVRHRSDEGLAELENSVSHYGILEPLIVRKKGSKYGVVIGSRRFGAAKAVGLKTVPAIVKELSDEEAFIESAVENIQRETLDPADELEVVEKAHEIFKEVAAVAKVFDRSKKWVEDRLRVHGIVTQIREARQKAEGPRAAPVSIPRDITKIANITRAADAVYDREPAKKVDLFEELKDKPRDQVDRTVRRLRAAAEEDPQAVARRPVKEVVSEIMEPNRLELSIEFSTTNSRGVWKAAKARNVSEEDIVVIAVEDWLRRNKFL